MALTTTPIELSSTPSIVDGGNATAITIDSSEFVEFANGASFGVSPHNEWESNYIGLEIGSSGFVYNRTSGNELFVSANAYYDSGWKYAADGRAGLLDLQGGRVRARTSNASGSQDGAITWVTALDIAADNGNVTLAGTLASKSHIVTGTDNTAFEVKTNHSGNPSAIRVAGSGSINGVNGSFQNFYVLNVMQDSGAQNSIYAAGNIKTDGNINIGTSGKGISFGATSDASGMSSELLDDYEEGTATLTMTAITAAPTITQGNTFTINYTKIGNLVRFVGYTGARNITNVGTGGAKFTGLPFTQAGSYYGQVTFAHTTAFATDVATGYIEAGGTFFYPITLSSTSAANYQTGTRYVMVQGVYHTA